jgi:hypothetical protein
MKTSSFSPSRLPFLAVFAMSNLHLQHSGR